MGLTTDDAKDTDTKLPPIEPTDWTQARDLVKENPKKLEDLKRLFLTEAGKYGVLPLDDRTYERFNPGLAGRRQPIKVRDPVRRHGTALRELGRVDQEQVLFDHCRRGCAQFRAEGVIIAQGGDTNGWSLYAKSGKHKYCYKPTQHHADLR